MLQWCSAMWRSTGSIGPRCNCAHRPKWPEATAQTHHAAARCGRLSWACVAPGRQWLTHAGL
eukprot:4137012-Lingulodinium_polyedra.AAC.1